MVFFIVHGYVGLSNRKRWTSPIYNPYLTGNSSCITGFYPICMCLKTGVLPINNSWRKQMTNHLTWRHLIFRHRINLFSNEYMSLVATHLLTGMQPPKLMSCCRDSNPHFLDFMLPGFRILRFWVLRVLVSSVWSLLWKMYEHFEHQKHWRYAGIWDCQRILTHITLLKYMTWHDMIWHCIALHCIPLHTHSVCLYVYIYIHIYIYISRS